MPRIVVGVGAGLMEIERGVVMVALGGLVWLRWWGVVRLGFKEGWLWLVAVKVVVATYMDWWRGCWRYQCFIASASVELHEAQGVGH